MHENYSLAPNVLTLKEKESFSFWGACQEVKIDSQVSLY